MYVCINVINFNYYWISKYSKTTEIDKLFIIARLIPTKEQMLSDNDDGNNASDMKEKWCYIVAGSDGQTSATNNPIMSALC